jgi:endoglycosylceramidase
MSDRDDDRRSPSGAAHRDSASCQEGPGARGNHPRPGGRAELEAPGLKDATRRPLALVIAGLTLGACTPPASDDTAPPSTPEPVPWLLDESGRAVIHRGMNVTGAAKWAEDYMPDVSEQSLATMQAAGVTFARVLSFWDAVEPIEGEYDEDYLALLDTFLGRMDQAGVAVMLDMHQDVWGVGFGGDGAPLWSCDEAYYESFEPPTGSWYMAYLSDEVQACFDQFWNDPGLQEQYAQAWAQLAAIAAEHPSVVGYDVMNEPFWGTATQEAFEEQLLPAFYERVIAGIRSVDAERCGFGAHERPCRFIALEPSTHVNLLPSRLIFPEAEGLVFAPHFYPTYAEEGTGFDGDLSNELEHLDGLIAHGQDAGLPVMLGEFGIFSAHGNEHDYVRGLQDLFEAHGGSTAYWSWDPNDSFGVVGSDEGPGPMLGAWSRPWLHRIPSAGLEIEPLEDGVRARFEAAEGETLLAIVPEACSEHAEIQGAAILAQDGVRWTLEPEETGATEVTIRGCG